MCGESYIRCTAKYTRKVRRVDSFADERPLETGRASARTAGFLFLVPRFKILDPTLRRFSCHSSTINSTFYDNHGVRVLRLRQALDRVNEEATKRAACGIAFLGDFWHARGSLKVISRSS